MVSNKGLPKDGDASRPVGFIVLNQTKSGEMSSQIVHAGVGNKQIDAIATEIERIGRELRISKTS